MSERKSAYYSDLGFIDYQTAHALQLGLVLARQSGVLYRDTFLFLEHEKVLTLGRRGSRENLLVTDAFLEKQGVPVIPVERGGDVTYHGPGQLVVYGICDLFIEKRDVPGFVFLLEESLIRTLGEYGLKGERLPLNRGVFVSSAKIGNIGIAIKKGVTCHGMALNVSLDLEPFSWINPCGLKGIRVTSLEKEVGGAIDMEAVKKCLRRSLEASFSLVFEEKKRSFLDEAILSKEEIHAA